MMRKTHIFLKADIINRNLEIEISIINYIIIEIIIEIEISIINRNFLTTTNSKYKPTFKADI